MRKSDVFRAMFSALYTVHTEEPDNQRDPELTEYFEKYMPNFGKNEPPKDNTVMISFRKFIDKRCKGDEIEEDEAYKLSRSYLLDNTKFGDVFTQVTEDDWKSLCDLIDMSNMVNAINAMKDEGTYESVVRSGQVHDIGEYIKNNPDIMEKANPDIAAQAMAGMAGMAMGNVSGAGAVSSAKPKKTIHPNQKKKKKKK